MDPIVELLSIRDDPTILKYFREVAIAYSDAHKDDKSLVRLNSHMSPNSHIPTCIGYHRHDYKQIIEAFQDDRLNPHGLEMMIEDIGSPDRPGWWARRFIDEASMRRKAGPSRVGLSTI
jgi:hypothetical protein